MTRNNAPYRSTARNRNAHKTSDMKQRPKYVGRRLIPPPKAPPNRHPTIAPTPERICVFALASDIVPPVNWSAHNGSHCTDPHVPIRAMEANAIASNMFLSSRALKISFTGRATLCFTDAFHRSDSGTNRSEEHTSELQSHSDLVCRLLLEKKKKKT